MAYATERSHSPAKLPSTHLIEKVNEQPAFTTRMSHVTICAVFASQLHWTVDVILQFLTNNWIFVFAT